MLTLLKGKFILVHSSVDSAEEPSLLCHIMEDAVVGACVRGTDHVTKKEASEIQESNTGFSQNSLSWKLRVPPGLL